MDPGILALLIPVIALATGFVAVLKMPPEAFLGKKKDRAVDGPRLQALEEEMSRLREELALTQERVDFTEKLLAGREPAVLPKGE